MCIASACWKWQMSLLRHNSNYDGCSQGKQRLKRCVFIRQLVTLLSWILLWMWEDGEAKNALFLFQYNPSNMCCMRCRTTISAHWRQKRTERRSKCRYRHSSTIAVCSRLWSLCNIQNKLTYIMDPDIQWRGVHERPCLNWENCRGQAVYWGLVTKIIMMCELINIIVCLSLC